MNKVPMPKVNRAGATEVAPELQFGKPASGLRLMVYTVIFEADTVAGKAFDVALIATILVSVAVVVMDSVESLSLRYGVWFRVLEWGFTFLFTAEYLARTWCVRHPLRYARSFFGVIDLLAFMPTYMALLFPQAITFQGVRVLRLLRIFRVFKLSAYVVEYRALGEALRASARKILIFLSVVLMAVLLLGTAMYVVEGPKNGYTSIPTSVYWAIVTTTTVGYGDVTPHTDLGKFIASVMMLLGWGILAVPTGIVTVEMTAQRQRLVRHPPTTRTCHECLSEGHETDAKFCKDCGARLPEYKHD
jgi:voltage-gated potassium channel